MAPAERKCVPHIFRPETSTLVARGRHIHRKRLQRNQKTDSKRTKVHQNVQAKNKRPDQDDNAQSCGSVRQTKHK
jgi:hypothetical protein